MIETSEMNIFMGKLVEVLNAGAQEEVKYKILYIFLYIIVISYVKQPSSSTAFLHLNWCGTYTELILIKGLYGPSLRMRLD